MVLMYLFKNCHAVCLKSSAITSSVIITTTVYPEEYCVWYEHRGLYSKQTNIQKLTNDQVVNYPNTVSNMYDCCNVCIANKEYCNVFIFDSVSNTCTQYTMNIKNTGSLNPYIIFNYDQTIGGIVSYIQ